MNTFIKNGSKIRRQVRGIPMGTNCAPLLANLYLYSYESDWIQKMSTTNLQQARGFHLSFRYIDDLLSLDNPAVDMFVNDGPYPLDLSLNDTTDKKDEVHFLGMSILADKLKFWIKIHDKRSVFPFEVQRYPVPNSTLPISIPKNVFIGQLHRFYHVCTKKIDFILTAADLALSFVQKGFSKKWIFKLFMHFCKRPLKYSSANRLFATFRKRVIQRLVS
jgi:hypothetical protein